jgi:hypothetical protein
MCAKINSNTLNIDSHSLYQPISPQFTEAGTLMNQGNLTSATAQSGNITLAVPILNTLGGLLGAGYGLHLSKQGLNETYTALKCCDTKGVVSGSVSTGVGIAFLGASSSMCANGVVGFLPSLGLSSLKAAQSLIAIFTTAINWLGLSLYSLYIGGAVAALPELRDFRNEFQNMMNSPRMCSKTKALEGLRFLKEKISFTDQEKASLNRIQPDLALKGEQRKWNQFIRSVGLECAEKVASELPQLFKEVHEGKLKNTEELLVAVNRGNFKQTVGQIAMLAAGILGSIGSVLALTAIGGYVTFALFASASALYWLNNVIGDIAYKIIAPSTDIARVCYNAKHAII